MERIVVKLEGSLQQVWRCWPLQVSRSASTSTDCSGGFVRSWRPRLAVSSRFSVLYPVFLLTSSQAVTEVKFHCRKR